MADGNISGGPNPSKRSRDASPEEDDHAYEGNDTCPLCKTRATAGRHSFQLQAIVNHYDSKRPPHKRARADEAAGVGQGQGREEKAEIYPFGVAPPVNQLPDQNEEDEDEGDMDDFAEDEDEEDIDDGDLFQLLVGGRIVFPCGACRPGHHSGYTCPAPIPEPTDAIKDSETQDYLNGRRLIAEPQRGDRRIPFEEGLHNLPGMDHLFTDELKREINRACEQHIACTRCSSYIPLDWPGRAQSICKGMIAIRCLKGRPNQLSQRKLLYQLQCLVRHKMQPNQLFYLQTLI
ncbi:hypothetical protein BN14_02823 [Rhizoctonia solani AG-1 IB]|uniref:Uncharacterized protein n=1 Tax=Thanatephorus cucumeris (strain AG1-IB / isolate 7/3/14) TaxID=1108050 RepID=M5BQS1_THACB|nr:hypothetical protein BN14_02823 [Rhizoctonia solani AG-1 IB]